MMLFSPNCVSTLRGSYCRKWPGLGQSTLRGAVLILISLTQPSLFVRVRSLSLWCSANFEIARATLSALLCVSGHSRRGALRDLTWLAQPSRHFVRVGSLSLSRGADFS